MNNLDNIERDEDGFIRLHWKNNKNPITTKPKKSKTKKVKKPKFKKGSWKEKLYKLITKYRKPKTVDKFHDKGFKNIYIHKNKVKEEVLPSKFNKKDSVLVNTGNNIYLKLSGTSYNKLTNLRRVAITYSVSTMEDFDNDYLTIYDTSMVIHDINQLLRDIVYFRDLIDGVAELQAYACSFTRFKISIKILAYTVDGNVETYKDLNKFIESYEITDLF